MSGSRRSGGFVPPPSTKKRAEEAQLREFFNEIDTDGSGFLDRDEIAALAKRLGVEFSERELDEAMAEMDADGGGEIDFEEFAAWWPRAQKSKLAAAMNAKAFKQVRDSIPRALQAALRHCYACW